MWIIGYRNHSSNDKKNSDRKMPLLLQNDTVIHQVENLMKYIIKKSIDEYIIFSAKVDDEDLYLNSDDQKTMIKIITDRIFSTITDEEIDALSLLYKMDELSIYDTIEYEVGLAILDLSISINKVK